MIGKDELVSLGKARGLAPWQEEKRYVQALVLHALRSEEMIMKGGTYLWFFHGLDRFSEDLDYTVIGEAGSELVARCAATLGTFGVSAKAKVVKDDRYTLTFRIDAQGPLYSGGQSLCRVLVEASRREKALREPIVVKLDEAGYLLPVDLIRGMALDEVTAEKVRSLLRRQQVRDAYDIWFLLKRKGVHFDEGLTNEKLEFYGQRFTPDDVAAALGRVAKDWSGGLKPLVFGDVPSFDEVREGIVGVLSATA